MKPYRKWLMVVLARLLTRITKGMRMHMTRSMGMMGMMKMMEVAKMMKMMKVMKMMRMMKTIAWGVRGWVEGCNSDRDGLRC